MSKRSSKTSGHKKGVFPWAVGLFIAGILLVLLAALVSVLFIRGTGFREEYRKRQYQQCLAQGTDRQVCHDSFQR